MTFDEAVAFAMEQLAEIDNLATSAHQMAFHVEQMADLSIDVEGFPYEPSWIEMSASSTLHWDAISMHCIALMKTGDDVPRPLRDWVAGVLATELTGQRARPSTPVGERKGRKEDRAQQQTMLWLTVEDMVSKGLTATRNDAAARHESACDAVANAMAKLRKTPNTYDGIKPVYQREKAYRAASHARFIAAIEAGTDPFDECG